MTAGDGQNEGTHNYGNNGDFEDLNCLATHAQSIDRLSRISYLSRFWVKNSRSWACDSGAITPFLTAGLWFILGSVHTLYRLPVAPAFRSAAPNTKVRTRALMRAPAHITHGSRVTTRSQSSRRQRPRCWAASRRASTSAWAVGSLVASRSLWRAAMMTPL